MLIKLKERYRYSFIVLKEMVRTDFSCAIRDHSRNCVVGLEAVNAVLCDVCGVRQIPEVYRWHADFPVGLAAGYQLVEFLR